MIKSRVIMGSSVPGKVWRFRPVWRKYMTITIRPVSTRESIGLSETNTIGYYILFFIHLETRKIHIAGITAHPDEAWMKHMARNLTMEAWGILQPGAYLIHDGDKKFCAAFKQMLDDAGVKRVSLPPRSPWLNAFAERWIQSVKTEVLSRMILFGEKSLRYVLTEYLAHYHTERPHQGKGNVMLFPSAQAASDSEGMIECRERLGGLLRYYHPKAA